MKACNCRWTWRSKSRRAGLPKSCARREAAAMIRSLFVSMGELNKGARRPKNVPATNIRKIGVLGAGFMGAGIAYVSAQAGIDVVLIDRDQASADKGKEYSNKLISGQIMKGRAKTADRDALLVAHQCDRRLCRAEGLRSHRRGRLRGPRHQGGSHEEGRSCHRAGRDLRLQHVYAADYVVSGEPLAAGELCRHSFLLAGREDDACRDHQRQGDRRPGARNRARFCARDQEDADRRQRHARLLRQSLRRQLHPRSASDAGRRRAAGDDRERRQDGRHAGRAARAQ